ncbi:hypothetical protein GCM10011309_02200 [Litorimonas cladophorae]|uniref:Uncharacterized protein n=1 Tax=Litorimonas cladophorae TaxID=1220491 RepID=A0A918NBS4_9PROT|nr:hypothetical protein [Litorimonas cladophorae]GGX56886.1 hypothetical protein GCM10011309_02200 [Litorimonas cladophorae]
MVSLLSDIVYKESTDRGLINPAKTEYVGGLIIHNSRSDWDAYLRTELNSLCNLSEDWDGYGSPAVSFENAELGLHLLNSLKQIVDNSSAEIRSYIPSSPYLVPVSGGALQAEWHLDSYFIELFFDSDEPIQAMFYSSDDMIDESMEIDCSEIQTNIRPLVNWFKRVHELNNARAIAV